MTYKTLLGKSDGELLTVHSKLVSRIAVKIAEKSLAYSDSEIIESIRIAGLLHDIGKGTKFFQGKLKKKTNETEIETKQKHRHNEVGWAFLSRNLNLPKRVLSLVLDMVYWHHGISTTQCDYNDIDIIINQEDSNIMRDYLKHWISPDNVFEKEFKPKKAPMYYMGTENEDANELNSVALFCRSCLISADRIASSLTNANISDGKIDSIIDSAIERINNDFDLKSHPYYGNDRFNRQMEIVASATNTTQINAPAGFGKTILGILWNLKRNKKLIWVCPRNIIAESIYKSISEELERFGIKLSIELYLSGEVQKHNELFISDFTSDIIVTNIDNYLSPSVDNRNAARLHTIINTDVIFDEFHELLGDSALYACFINLMMTRNRMTNSNTLLLSATPTQMYRLWDSNNKKTQVLPKPHTHYPAAHTNKYLLKTSKEIPSIQESNTLMILNSISNGQIYKQKAKITTLLHSRFEAKDRTSNFNKLYELYGKQSVRNIVKESMIGTHIVQASLDVSFKHLTESVLSPQATLQRIGRIDRWGDYEGESVINVANLFDNSEVSMKRLLYSSNLSNMWFEFLQKYDNKKLTLDELYEIYNTFEERNQKVLYEHLMCKYSDSLNELSKLHPVKFFNNIKKNEIKTAGSNKLRSSNSEVFVICKYYNKKIYTEPFSVMVRKSFEDEFHETSTSKDLKKILIAMKALRDMNDERFDYNAIISDKKYITIPRIRTLAKKSNTPYIRFDKVYHPQYGEISETLLNQLLTT